LNEVVIAHFKFFGRSNFGCFFEGFITLRSVRL